jgi:hypothetical protein
MFASGASRASAASVAVCAACLVAAPGEARADVTSWLAVGSGYAGLKNRFTSSWNTGADLTYSLGVGTSPLSPVVIGGVVRGTSMLGLSGTDLGVALRLASGGYARGEWGLALDLGGVVRAWGDDAYGTLPLAAAVTLGAPWGLGLALSFASTTEPGGSQSYTAFAAIEIDLLRLTVMRQGPSERWWPNPAPAGGRTARRVPEPDTSQRAFGFSSSAFIE